MKKNKMKINKKKDKKNITSERKRELIEDFYKK